MKPGTDLPWRIFSYGDTLEISPPAPSKLGERPAVVFWQGFDGNGLGKRANHKNAAYIVHACNAYPRLVDVLRQLRVLCISNGYPTYGLGADVDDLLYELEELAALESCRAKEER